MKRLGRLLAQTICWLFVLGFMGVMLSGAYIILAAGSQKMTDLGAEIRTAYRPLQCVGDITTLQDI